MEPVVNGLNNDYGDQLAVIALNAQAEGREAFEVGNLPGHPAYVVMLPDGTEVWRGFGLLDRAEIEAAILDALNRME